MSSVDIICFAFIDLSKSLIPMAIKKSFTLGYSLYKFSIAISASLFSPIKVFHRISTLKSNNIYNYNINLLKIEV